MDIEKQIDRMFENDVPIHKPGTRRQRVFDVYLDGTKIDTITYGANTNVDADEVKRSLINHDGYSPNIDVHDRTHRAFEM